MGRVRSLAAMSPRSVRTRSEHAIANRGVKIGCTRLVDGLPGAPVVMVDETQRSRTNATNSRVSARLDSA